MSARKRRRTEPSAAPKAPEAARRLPLFPWPVVVGLLLSLVLLLAHARMYAFLTDDSYISFRYARNFARGFGLVFNPGYERVEGYTNFLWVVILAALDRLGIVPEKAANPMSFALTVALWGIVVAFARRRAPQGREWLVLVPAFGLALTRSIAVWSSSGLETRFFEVLVVAGVLRLVVELEAQSRNEESQPLACWLLALATITRPDGLLLSGCAFLVGAAWFSRGRRVELFAFVRRQIPFAFVVVAHLLFRRLYYGDWLPNTYYAKVGGHLWWSSGFRYFAAFALEYGLVFWIPLGVLAFQFNRARRTPLFPLMVAGIVLPHALYIAAVGGDHFEFRPLDVYFPFAFLILQDGVAQATGGRARTLAVAGWLVLLGLGLTLIPWESHRQFVRIYRPGFPGGELKDEPTARTFLSPDRDPLLRLPGVRQLALVHRDLTRWMTLHFVAIRQEEHKMFLATAIKEGLNLRELRERGLLPTDTYIAVDCVGAIPYYSELRTLDRLGLTDAHVAHSPMLREIMAHGKSATLEYGRERGVDLWSIDPVHLILPTNSTRMLVAIKDGFMTKRPYYAIDVGEMGYLICLLPRGIEAERARLPGVNIFSFGDSSFIQNFIARGRDSYQESLAVDPWNLRAARNLGYLMLLAEDYPSARHLYEVMSQYFPTLIEGHENLALCDDMLGHEREAIAAARQAMALAQKAGDAAAIERINARFASIQGTGGAPDQKGGMAGLTVPAAESGAARAVR